VGKHLADCKGIIFDLDDTLVNTSMLLEMRKSRAWSTVYNNIHQTKIFDGIADLLSDLRDVYEMGIVTSSPRKYAEKVVAFHKLNIRVLTAYHDTQLHKPNPSPIIHGCNQLDINVNEVLSIGDDIKDVEASNKAGANSVFASWGSTAETCPIADYECHSVDHLRELLI